MEFTYERDDTRRRVVITTTGPFEAEVALAAIEAHHSEKGAWGYAVLYDLRRITGVDDSFSLL